MQNINNLIVRPVKKRETHDWLLNIHYAHRIPSISYAFGVYEENMLIGVCTFGTPASSTLLKGVCGEEHKSNVIELNRLALLNNTKNLASYFVSRAIRQLPKPKIIVSYADTKLGHVGKVYQACNFFYTGLSSKFIDPMVKGLEHQHHATYANGKTNDQLREEYGDRLYFKERSRKHRYIYFHASKTHKKSLKKSLSYSIKPYPKGESERYEVNYEPNTQTTLF